MKQEANEISIVLFHGYGADSNDLMPLREVFPNALWHFPNGPLKINLGYGMAGRAWFSVDLVKLQSALHDGDYDRVTQAFPSELTEIRNETESYIASLKIPKEKIILGGFSQGAVLATELALHSNESYRGLLIFSGALINKETWQKLAPKHEGSHFFQSHGDHDPLLPLKNAKDLESLLLNAGWIGKLHTFRGGHEIPSSIISALRIFITPS